MLTQGQTVKVIRPGISLYEKTGFVSHHITDKDGFSLYSVAFQNEESWESWELWEDFDFETIKDKKSI